MGLDTPDRFSAILKRESTFMSSCLAVLHTKPLLKGVYAKRKEYFFPTGNKFFPFRIDTFSEGRQNNFDRIVSPEKYQFPLNELLHVTKAF